MELDQGQLDKTQAWAVFVSRRNGIFPHSCPVSPEDLEQEAIMFQLAGRQSVSGPMQDLLRKGHPRGGRRQFLSLETDIKSGRGPRESDSTFSKPIEVDLYREPRPERATLKLPPKAVEHLDCRRREVIRLRYWEGKTLKQIGEIMGFNESRACQLHSEALKTLKQSMAHA